LDLELIIYFNLPFIWLSWYQKNISTSGWYQKNISASQYGLFLKKKFS